MNASLSSPDDSPILITPYCPQWAQDFEQEAVLIRNQLASQLVALEHIGSTSIPGLAAKPIIDMLAGLRNLSDAASCIPSLAALGYHYIPEFEDTLPERRYFEKTQSPDLGFHLHMVEVNSPFFIRHTAFRDYLRTHPDDAKEYGQLKKNLAAKFGSNRNGYTDAKTDFIQRIEKLALSQS